MVKVTENKITIIDDITFETESGGAHYYLGQYLADFQASVSRIMRDVGRRYCLELTGRGLDVFVIYVDAEGGEQKVRFTNIRVDKVFQTVASGDIPEQNKFMLNQYFAFKGTAQIEANKLGMFFKGGNMMRFKRKI